VAWADVGLVGVEQLLAQRSWSVLALHDAFVLQHRHHVIEELVVGFRHERVHDLYPVDAGGLQFEEAIGDGLRCAGQGSACRDVVDQTF
jgi:hypothetical protein